MNITIETKYRVMWIDPNGNKGDMGGDDMSLEDAYAKMDALRGMARTYRYEIYEVNHQIPVVHA